MDLQASNVYATIPGMPELGMVWMGDMMVAGDPTQELLLDPRPAESPYYTQTAHSFDDIRNHHIPPTAMVRYMPAQFDNQCSEVEDPMEVLTNMDDIQQVDYNTQTTDDMNGYLSLEEYSVDKEQEANVNNAATQTQEARQRKIKPIKHPALVLKTPIAYEPHTDLNFIPIREDGRGVCEKCGAIGVKHSFYTKERRFCSRECARSSENAGPTADSTYSSNISAEQTSPEKPVKRDCKPSVSKIKVKEEVPLSSVKETPVESSTSTRPQIPTEPVMPEDLPVRRKRTAEMAGSYDWTSQLTEPGFCAAPVSCFKHAPISEIWDNISIGMKVEVENTDCDEVCEAFPDSFWVATVLRICGYRALLRYEGFGHDNDKDFWVSLCSNDIHPVGWCATIGKPLIPPNTISNKYKDWKDFLMRRLTGARTLPTNFYNKVNDSMKSRFRCGMHLEVVDKNRISQVKVATIQKIVGKRLHVRYYDSSPEDNGFWCHEDSPLIHPVGWAKRVGQSIDAYPEYLTRVDTGKLHPDDATGELFYVPKFHHPNFGYKFKEGMKVEAIDPLNLSSICAATVMRVLKENYIMIRIDSYDEDASGSDWFCYHAYSPCIFPIGFCAQHGLPLTPPKGYDPTTFSWDSYISETKATPAPSQLFNWDIPQHGFIEGMRLEAADLMDPRLVCVATITRVIGRLLRVHFDGWEDEYDQWLDCQSPDIYPVGWCDLVDHKLEGPRAYVGKNLCPPVKSPRGLKRKGKRKMKKNVKTFRSTFTTRQMERNQMARNRQKELELRELETEIGSDRDLGPAQGTLIEREHHEESIPLQNGREPEAAEVPIGPDQTLPISTSGHVQSNGAQNVTPGQSSTGDQAITSYANSTSTNLKYIPRISDVKSSDVTLLTPTEWDVSDVAQFLQVNDWDAYCDNFSKRKIDGKALLDLTEDQIIELNGFKVGPSLKIFNLIQQLKNKLNPGQERMKFGLKKIL